MSVDWVEEASSLFRIEKPDHFTEYRHCCECAEHDETLRSSNVAEIGLQQLGNPGWDPLCFATVEGLKYYLPAMVRLSIETINTEFYVAQMLFHLGSGGKENRLLVSVTPQQKDFVARFLAFLISTYPSELEERIAADEALATYELWSKGH